MIKEGEKAAPLLSLPSKKQSEFKARTAGAVFHHSAALRFIFTRKSSKFT